MGALAQATGEAVIMHPVQRAAMVQLREHFPSIEATERRFRRLDWLLGVSVVIGFTALALWNSTASPVWRGIIVGAAFALGIHAARWWSAMSERRSAYAQLCALDEVASLSLALDDDEDDDT